MGYANLGLSAQNLPDHAAAIMDENPQISARGDSSTVLDETEEVSAAMFHKPKVSNPPNAKVKSYQRECG